jgi:hypothetical protein
MLILKVIKILINPKSQFHYENKKRRICKDCDGIQILEEEYDGLGTFEYWLKDKHPKNKKCICQNFFI